MSESWLPIDSELAGKNNCNAKSAVLPPQRPGGAYHTSHDARKCGHFSRSLREREVKRMRGGVRSQIRTRLHLQFPAIREINREFCDFRASGGDISTKSPVPQSLLGKFPTQINRENILKNREVLSDNREFHLQGGEFQGKVQGA